MTQCVVISSTIILLILYCGKLKYYMKIFSGVGKANLDLQTLFARYAGPVVTSLLLKECLICQAINHCNKWMSPDLFRIKSDMASLEQLVLF
jgi:hypothetical protein